MEADEIGGDEEEERDRETGRVECSPQGYPRAA